jgi:undecaprenyl-diphosphatase
LNIKSILFIGLFQILSIIPGVSRSGIVITAGRFLNFDRFDSTKISFYLSIPAIAGASVLTLKDLTYETINFNIVILFAIIFAFIVSYLSIKYFLIFTKKFSMTIFVIYRIILSLILFYIIYY